MTDGRLTWQSSDRRLDKGDETRWCKLGDVTHPAIAHVLSSRRKGGRWTVEFETPGGKPLTTFLAPAAGSPGLDTLNSLALLVQLGSALEAMHNLDLFGLSVTPACIYVHPDRTDPSYTLVPLLLPGDAARLLPEDYVREGPDCVLPYVAQERLRAQPVTPAADVYALGVLGSQVLQPASMPTYANRADLIHALVSGRLQAQVAPRGKGNAAGVVRQCLARRPGRRPAASEARTGFAAALREFLCQPCEEARRLSAKDLDAALQALSDAMEDAILDRNPLLHLTYAELVAHKDPEDQLPVIAAGRAAVERVERLFDEEQMADPMDRYFTANVVASPEDAQLIARRAYVLLGNVYYQQGLSQKAMEQYDRALKVAGDEGQLLLGYAGMLREAGRPGEALSALERAERVGVEDERLLCLEKARAMERQGMLEQAAEAYTTALELGEDGATWTQIGKLYLAIGPGKRDGALHAFGRAIELDPQQLEASTHLADLALEQGNEDAALAALDSVRLPSSFQQVALPVWQRFLEVTGTLMERTTERLRQNRSDPAVYRRLGDLFLLRAHLGDDGEDLERYEQASGDYLRALLSYQASLELNPGQSEIVDAIREIQVPLTQEQKDLEDRIKAKNVTPDVLNRLALVDWRLATFSAGSDMPANRRNAVALLKRAVEVLDLSLQQDLDQARERKLFGALAEQLRHLEGQS
jgi:tetratricopeptide (TPR) repeat protein